MVDEGIFRLVFFSLFGVFVAIRVYHARKIRQSGQSLSPDRGAIAREGWGILLLRYAVFLGLFIAVGIYLFDPGNIAWLALPLPAWLRWLGVALGLAGLPALVWVHHALGHQWSTHLQLSEEHALVTSGPYRWVRHPMYTVFIAFMFALALVSASGLLGLLGLITTVWLVLVRAGKEEQMMIVRFGDAYRVYMQRTGRFLPRRSES